MKRFFFLPILLTFFLACSGGDVKQDENNAVPKGDPIFTPLSTSWVIDKASVLSETVIAQGSTICQQLQNDGVAEMVVLVQNDIKRPEDYATHYGRWLRLGKKGLSAAGGNNGIVWLIRPDATEKVTISVGRGLPKFTSSDYGQIIDESINYLNFNNYDQGVLKIIKETDRKLREIYQKQSSLKEKNP